MIIDDPFYSFSFRRAYKRRARTFFLFPSFLHKPLPPFMKSKFGHLRSEPCAFPISRPYFFASITFSAIGIATCKYHFVLLQNGRPFSTDQAKSTPVTRFGIGSAVISRCYLALKRKPDTLLDNCSSLHEILNRYGNLFPEITRRFWRVSHLRPAAFLDLLISLEPDADSSFIVEFLWNLFRWAPNRNQNFHHLPRSYDIMMSLLIRSQMLEDAEFLAFSSDSCSIFSNPSMMFSDIIQGYAKNFLSRNSVALYNQAKNLGLKLSSSCYQALLNLLIEVNNSELAIRVYMDMMESEFGLCADVQMLDFVATSLGKKGKTLQAVNILRQARKAGVQASTSTLDAVVQGYSSRKDYEDALLFMKEWTHTPSSSSGNKLVSSICKNLGSDYAWFLTQELQTLGFQADDITFGILIIQSCKEGKLRDAFIYLSESFSHRIKLNVHAYNAIIGGVLKEGMCKAATDIFEEMVESEVFPNLSTLKTLLAGCCKYRKFHEIKKFLTEMENSGFISVVPGVDPLYKAFTILGLDHLGFKIKRDNDARVSRAEYFDCLGNGLYLETNHREYEKILDEIMDAAMNPDFDSLLFKECHHGNLDRALRMKDEIDQWGHHLSLQTCSQFLKAICKSSSHLKEAMIFLDDEPELWNQMDGDTMNLVVQSLSKNGMAISGRSVLERLLKRGLPVDNATHNAMILGFYEMRNIRQIHEYLELLERIVYSPCSEEIDILVSCLCKLQMVEKMFAFFDIMSEKDCNLVPSFVNAILKNLDFNGFSSTGTVFLEEVFNRIQIVDRSFLVNLTKNTCQKSFRFLLHFLIGSGRIEEALVLKQLVLSRKGINANFVYAILLNELCMIGNLKEADSQLEEMLLNGELFPNYHILNAFVNGFCRQNNLKKALEIFTIMLRTHANLSISSYRCLVRQLCIHGLLSGALNLYKLIQIEDSSESLMFQNILIFSLFWTKNFSLIDTVLDRMREKHLLRDNNTCNFLVYGYNKLRIMPKAIKVFYDMISHGMIPNHRSFRNIICYFCGNGELSKALELSNIMINHGYKLGSCIQTTLTMSLISCDRHSEALTLFDRIEERKLIPEHVQYDILIKEFSMKGNVMKAIHLLNLMLKKGSIPSQTSYISVIHGLCVCKFFDEALDFYEEMLHKGLVPTVATTNTLIYGLIYSGRTDDARRILSLMLHFDIFPDYSMYNYVIRSYYTENNMEKASELVQEMQKVGYSPNFETHWSLISKLSSRTQRKHNKGFLYSLLSMNGIPVNNRKDKGISAI